MPKNYYLFFRLKKLPELKNPDNLTNFVKNRGSQLNRPLRTHARSGFSDVRFIQIITTLTILSCDNQNVILGKIFVIWWKNCIFAKK